MRLMNFISEHMQFLWWPLGGLYKSIFIKMYHFRAIFYKISLKTVLLSYSKLEVGFHFHKITVL